MTVTFSSSATSITIGGTGVCTFTDLFNYVQTLANPDNYIEEVVTGIFLTKVRLYVNTNATLEITDSDGTEFRWGATHTGGGYSYGGAGSWNIEGVHFVTWNLTDDAPSHRGNRRWIIGNSCHWENFTWAHRPTVYLGDSYVHTSHPGYNIIKGVTFTDFAGVFFIGGTDNVVENVLFDTAGDPWVAGTGGIRTSPGHTLSNSSFTDITMLEIGDPELGDQTGTYGWTIWCTDCTFDNILVDGVRYCAINTGGAGKQIWTNVISRRATHNQNEMKARNAEYYDFLIEEAQANWTTPGGVNGTADSGFFMSHSVCHNNWHENMEIRDWRGTAGAFKIQPAIVNGNYHYIDDNHFYKLTSDRGAFYVDGTQDNVFIESDIDTSGQGFYLRRHWSDTTKKSSGNKFIDSVVNGVNVWHLSGSYDTLWMNTPWPASGTISASNETFSCYYYWYPNIKIVDTEGEPIEDVTLTFECIQDNEVKAYNGWGDEQDTVVTGASGKMSTPATDRGNCVQLAQRYRIGSNYTNYSWRMYIDHASLAEPSVVDNIIVASSNYMPIESLNDFAGEERLFTLDGASYLGNVIPYTDTSLSNEFDDYEFMQYSWLTEPTELWDIDGIESGWLTVRTAQSATMSAQMPNSSDDIDIFIRLRTADGAFAERNYPSHRFELRHGNSSSETIRFHIGSSYGSRSVLVQEIVSGTSSTVGTTSFTAFSDFVHQAWDIHVSGGKYTVKFRPGLTKEWETLVDNRDTPHTDYNALASTMIPGGTGENYVTFKIDSIEVSQHDAYTEAWPPIISWSPLSFDVNIIEGEDETFSVTFGEECDTITWFDGETQIAQDVNVSSSSITYGSELAIGGHEITAVGSLGEDSNMRVWNAQVEPFVDVINVISRSPTDSGITLDVGQTENFNVTFDTTCDTISWYLGTDVIHTDTGTDTSELLAFGGDLPEGMHTLSAVAETSDGYGETEWNIEIQAEEVGELDVEDRTPTGDVITITEGQNAQVEILFNKVCDTITWYDNGNVIMQEEGVSGSVLMYGMGLGIGEHPITVTGVSGSETAGSTWTLNVEEGTIPEPSEPAEETVRIVTTRGKRARATRGRRT